MGYLLLYNIHKLDILSMNIIFFYIIQLLLYIQWQFIIRIGFIQWQDQRAHVGRRDIPRCGR
jgi:hypothetical protein